MRNAEVKRYEFRWLPCNISTRCDASIGPFRIPRSEFRVMKIGIVTISDRASQGVYEDRGGPAICFQYLGIPELDDRLETPSMQAFVDTPMWSRPAAEKSWEWYLGDLWRTDDVPAYASPARAEPSQSPNGVAEDFFQRGKALMLAKDYAQACPLFAVYFPAAAVTSAT